MGWGREWGLILVRIGGVKSPLLLDVAAHRDAALVAEREPSQSGPPHRVAEDAIATGAAGAVVGVAGGGGRGGGDAHDNRVHRIRWNASG